MKQKAALVLSGGGARGIAHIGVIEELEKQGFEITSIAGTSMGALVGGAFALGKMEALKMWLSSLDRLKVFNLLDFTLSSQGFIKGDKVFKKMKEFITDKNIEDLDIPYAAVAVDIINKKEVVFTTGSIYKAIRASVAIPTVLTPIRTEEGLLVDGGVMNNIPINHVKRTHDDLLIVVDVNAEVPVLKPPKTEEENKTMLHIYHKKILAFYNQFQPESQQSADEKFGYFDLLNHTIGFMTHQIAMQKLEKHPPDLVINISNQICNAFDFYKAEELIEIGRYVTQKRMEDHE